MDDSLKQQALAYHVFRTPSQELPVYHCTKSGGNRLQTRIRKIQGNVYRLRDEIIESLDIKREDAVVNSLNQDIILKVRLGSSRAALRNRGGTRIESSRS